MRIDVHGGGESEWGTMYECEGGVGRVRSEGWLKGGFFFQAEGGIRVDQESRGLGDVYKRKVVCVGVCVPVWVCLCECVSVSVCACVSVCVSLCVPV